MRHLVCVVLVGALPFAACSDDPATTTTTSSSTTTSTSTTTTTLATTTTTTYVANAATISFLQRLDIALSGSQAARADVARANGPWTSGAMGDDDFASIVDGAIDTITETYGLVTQLRPPKQLPEAVRLMVASLAVDLVSLRVDLGATEQTGRPRTDRDSLARDLRSIAADLAVAARVPATAAQLVELARRVEKTAQRAADMSVSAEIVHDLGAIPDQIRG